MIMSEIIEQRVVWLLDGWKRGLISAEDVHHHAEKWTADERIASELNENSAAAEILSQLDILNQQLITSEDIPEMLEFIGESKKNASEARNRWEKYWSQIDFSKRQQTLAEDVFYAC